MKRSPLPRSRKPIARSPIKKRPRKKSETLRIYGPPARREFVKSLPCAACGVVGYSENAHLLGNGGMGRKAGYLTVGPLCGNHPSASNQFTIPGCHYFYDNDRKWFDAHLAADFDPERVARETEKLWLESGDTETP